MSDFDDKAASYDARPVVQNISKGVVLGLKAKLGLTQDMAVLDFGCGTGLVALQVADSVGHVVGVDTSDGMIKAFTSKLQSADAKNVTALCCDLRDSNALQQAVANRQEGKQTPTEFDLIYCSMTLHHLQDIEGTLKLLAQYLKQGSALVAFDFEKSEHSMLFHPQPVSPSVHHPGGFETEQLKQLWSAAGLKDVVAERVHKFDKEVEVNGNKESKQFWLLMVRGTKP
jgi:ubiquinone/menaquinone biosynthesis C-methylase UbiE